jgi:serine/threonine-protein kinase RsbW
MTDQRAQPTVELRLPADGAYAAVLRTTAAALAARLDFTVDDIEDLRIAAGEASALVIPEAEPGAELLTRFHLGPGTMTVELSTSTADEPAPDYDSFAWQVLDTLAEEASVESSDGSFLVRFMLTAQTARSGPSVTAVPGAGSDT